MGDIDPLKTQHTAIGEVTAELADAGFSGAEEIGHGGFGVVFRCAQVDLDRVVAIKVLTADLDEENRERFVREQRAMGRLTGHPNIVGVLQVGTTVSGLPYLVMPFYPQDSLEVRIRRHGPLPVEETLRLGVKLAGALETGHQLGILHRDIKPGNILLSEYGEPALTDFGIARIPGGFHTTAGTITGSPAFTAPEVLAGEPPSPAADVYGLGATLFAALTGHAAFERHRGEQVVAQFLRITSQPVPSLREQGIDADLAAVIERAMARDPAQRPSPKALGEQLQRLQADRGRPVDDMAVRSEAVAAPPESGSVPPVPLISGRAPVRRRFGSPVGAEAPLPVELTSFIGRRTDLTEAKRLLANYRLVTLTGIGGVGKTRLALRVAVGARKEFADGLWLVELAELQDGALLPGVIAAAVGLRPQAQPVLDVLVEYLASRRALLVLDNCEQIIDATAKVVETLLRACPTLRVLATSREPLNIGGEAVLQVRPLSVPAPDRRLSLRGTRRCEAVELFVERATAAVPEFTLTEDNVAAVAEICQRLDGLPLAIELAAARLRTLAPEQILARLTDRYGLLTRGSRNAPSRQQTLRWCIDWSYSLCTPAEQQVWVRLSVFAGSFELDAAEQVCSCGLAAENLFDVLAALVDKSVVIRETSDSVVRFRMLETVREYGRDKIHEAGEYPEVLRRHRDWYRAFAERAEAGWFGPRQRDWIARIEREQPNIREALNSCLRATDLEPDAALSLAATIQLFWFSRGQLGEARYWLDHALALEPATATVARARALWRACLVTESQDDLADGSSIARQARDLLASSDHPVVRAFANLALSLHSVSIGDSPSAGAPLRAALAVFTEQDDVYGRIWCLLGLGWVHVLRNDCAQALACYEEALEVIESYGGSVHLVYALWGAAVAAWCQGDRDRALALLRKQLQQAREQQNLHMGAIALETLAWVVGTHGSARRTAVLLGAAHALAREIGASPVLFPETAVHHEDCARSARRTLGAQAFEAAYRKGMSLDLLSATGYALDERPQAVSPGAAAELTKREREVADLVAEGLTNKAVATRLHISQRTAAGHVEHILTKLGFTSRAQIAAWITEQGDPAQS